MYTLFSKYFIKHDQILNSEFELAVNVTQDIFVLLYDQSKHYG